MHRLPVALLLAFTAMNAHAQIIRPRSFQSPPSAWVSLGIGSQNAFVVADGSTNSAWEFGSATPWIAAIEKPVGGGGILLGLQGSTANIGLFYRGVGTMGGGTDADANVSEGFVTVRTAGGGGAFHSLFEGGAGATVFSNFRSRSSGLKVGPASPDPDFAFFLAYGAGYNLSPRFSVDVSQRITTSVHQATGLSAGSDSNVRVSSFEIVGRLGLGGR